LLVEFSLSKRSAASLPSSRKPNVINPEYELAWNEWRSQSGYSASDSCCDSELTKVGRLEDCADNRGDEEQ